MTIAIIFAALLWGVTAVALIVGAILSAYHVTTWATGATLASGLAIRGLALCAALALLIGGPLMILGWA